MGVWWASGDMFSRWRTHRLASIQDSPYNHKRVKTTLDLPADVALTLRMESARRGGRKAASLSKLVADAVRKVYGASAPPPSRRSQLTPGRVVVAAAPDAPLVTAERIQSALYDDTGL